MASLLGVVAAISSLLGLNLTASSIGGADMLVVIAILNS